MNDHSYNEPRLDETPAVDIINVSYCIGRMEVPIRRASTRHSGVPDHYMSTDQSGSGRNALPAR